MFLCLITKKWKLKSSITITEFGFTKPFEGTKANKADIIFDSQRSFYYKKYLKGILIAISKGINVVRYLA
ncbi:glycoside hydrolase family 1 protein [Cadophora sp. DSE1049]|nr:glycoside hydrolase family 1 protein [Cadophora sp. DSE1049]